MEQVKITQNMLDQSRADGYARKQENLRKGMGQDTSLNDEYWACLSELLIVAILDSMEVGHSGHCGFSLDKSSYKKEDLLVDGKTIDIKSINPSPKRQLALVNIRQFKSCDYYVFVKFHKALSYTIKVATKDEVMSWNVFDLYEGKEAYCKRFDELQLELVDITNAKQQ